MTLTVNLTPTTIEKLRAESAVTGKDVDTLVQEAIDSKLTERKRSLFEILKPIHDEVERSGISEADLDALIEHEIEAARAEKRRTAQS